MITTIAIILVLGLYLITALVMKLNTVLKLEKKVNDLGNKFNDSYQAYTEFHRIYRELAESYKTADKLYSQSYNEIKETYTRLINLLKDYTKCLPENIRAELRNIEDRERELKELQNQILKDIENNPNYDDETKQNLKEQVLNREI